ncbi:MAG: PadR family transcriptional regulator, partial [Cyanobacteria bacterium P01_C01_bin.72]
AHTILATLGNNAFSGYDLWKEFSQCSTHYWQASQQQIYRELTKLEKQGALAYEMVAQEGRPDKKVYSITPEGKKILVNWIAEPSSPATIREELLVKVLAAHLVPLETVIAEIQRRRQLHKEQLTAYLEAETEKFADLGQLSLEKKCMYLTLRRGIRLESQWVEWCDEAIAFLRQESSD